MPVPVRMMDTVDTPAPLTHFLRVRLVPGMDGTLEAHMAGPQGSNLLRTMALAHALLEVPETSEKADAGTLYRAFLLPGETWRDVAMSQHA